MSISMGPYNAPTITEPFTIQDFYMKEQENKEEFQDNKSYNSNKKNNSYILISPYLEKFIKLWVWDWDDTLIDIGSYIRHKMDRNTILELSDTELEFDVPNWLYFRNLVNYLVSSGRRVGIASFGTYSIIRAYMDRIFGFGQKIFTEINIYAACQSIDNVCMPRTIPINKNAYIQRLMKHYAIDNPKNVILFDDNSTNIADCARMGVIPIKIQSLNSINLDNESSESSIKYLGNTPASDIRNNLNIKRSILFGPNVMTDIEARIRKMCQDNPLEYDKQFGQLGDFKTMKRQERMVGDIINRNIEPNFNIDAFINLGHGQDFNDLKTKPKPKPELTPEQIKANRKKQKQDKINFELEGFQTEKNGFDNYNIIDNIALNVSGLLSGNINDTREGFSSCMSCKSPVSTWFIVFLFLLMICLITSMFYL